VRERSHTDDICVVPYERCEMRPISSKQALDLAYVLLRLTKYVPKAREATSNGVDAFAIAELLGHRDLQTTKLYTHATEARRRRAVEDLVGYGQNIVTKFVTKINRQP